MKTIATGRLAQAAGRYAEHAPMATACCNACRTCVTTNAISLAAGAGMAALAFLGAAGKRLRLPGRS
jgi:hypothetical protein